MSTVISQGERPRGRPRDTDKDDSIRAATWNVLAGLGYGGLTFEAVAEAAGCTRATLYRRFRSKLELIAAVFHETSREFEPSALADLAPHDALLALIEGSALFMSGVRGTAILAIASAAARVPELRTTTNVYKLHERDLHWAIFRKIAPEATEERLAFAFDSLIGLMLSHTVLSGTELSDTKRMLIADAIERILLHDDRQ